MGLRTEHLLAWTTVFAIITGTRVFSVTPASEIGDFAQSFPIQHNLRLKQARELIKTGSILLNSESTLDSLEEFILHQVEAALPYDHKYLARRIAGAIITASNETGLDPVFVMAVIQRESQFNINARGTSGELGLMQMKPSTAEWISQKMGRPWRGANSLLIPEVNIVLGSSYLQVLRRKFRGDGRYYIAAYNMGVLNVNRSLRRREVPQIYMESVMRHYRDFYLQFHGLPAIATRDL
jgi:soluble lytic murein transglycosylase